MLLLVYVTFPDLDTAFSCARALVELRLAAGANIIQGECSIYRWNGSIHESAEFLMFAQTTSECYPALERAILATHPYAVPCVVAVPIACGSGPFLDWITANTDVNSQCGRH